MKTLQKIGIAFLLLNLWGLLVSEKATAQAGVSLQVFYDDMSPYGNWVNSPDYGYVWIPDVGQGFTPYNSSGHWVYTEYGWTWVSDYPWGWAPFHYGRWYSDPYYGWFWVPDTEWGPGWVTWRHSDSYYGWAPIGPGISIDMAYSNNYNVPHNHWTFVRNYDFGRANINQYYVNNSNNTILINNTTIINNIHNDNSRNSRYNSGPDRKEVQQRTGNDFAPVAVRDRDTPGQQMSQKELQLYRPRVDRDNSNGNRAVPTKVMDIKEVKPQAERSPKSSTPTSVQPSNRDPNIRDTKPSELPPTRGVTPLKVPKPDKQPARNNPVPPTQPRPQRNTTLGTMPQRQQQRVNQQPPQQRQQRQQRVQQNNRPVEPQRQQAPVRQQVQQPRPQNINPQPRIQRQEPAGNQPLGNQEKRD